MPQLLAAPARGVRRGTITGPRVSAARLTRWRVAQDEFDSDEDEDEDGEEQQVVMVEVPSAAPKAAVVDAGASPAVDAESSPVVC